MAVKFDVVDNENHNKIHAWVGGQVVWTLHPHPLKNYKAIGFLSNTGSAPLKDHKISQIY